MADADKWAALRDHCASGRVKQRSFTGCHDGESLFAPRVGDAPPPPPGSSSPSGTPGRRRQRVKAHSMPALHEGFAQSESSTKASGKARGGSLGSDSDKWAALHEHCASGRVKQRSFAGTDHELFRSKGEGNGSSREFFDLGGTVIREETFESDGVENAKEDGKEGKTSVASTTVPSTTTAAAPAPAPASTPATADTGCSCVLL